MLTITHLTTFTRTSLCRRRVHMQSAPTASIPSSGPRRPFNYQRNYYSDLSPHRVSRPSSQTNQNNPFIQPNPYTREFPDTVSFVWRNSRLFLKYSAVSLLAVTSLAFIVFESTHLYVEHVALTPRQPSQDITSTDRAFAWDTEAESWTGPAAVGGTDPALTWRERHAIRSAWMLLNWRASTTSTSTQHGESQLPPAAQYIQFVLQSTSTNDATSLSTRLDLLNILARICQSSSNTAHLTLARSCYEKASVLQSSNSIDAARTLSRLANVISRLGIYKEAEETWYRSIATLGPTVAQSSPALPSALPEDPPARRLLIQNFLALSTHYATSGQLPNALQVQSTALALYRPIHPSTNRAPISPYQLLHDLYIQHRFALLELQHAEVVYALSKNKKNPDTSIFLLTSACSSFEDVIRTLSGLSDESSHKLYNASIRPPTQVDPAFASIKDLSQPSDNLLHDALRSAASSYNILGILLEKKGPSACQMAFECFENALWWNGGPEGPAEHIPETEWKAVWTNYVRAREAVRESDRASARR